MNRPETPGKPPRRLSRVRSSALGPLGHPGRKIGAQRPVQTITGRCGVWGSPGQGLRREVARRGAVSVPPRAPTPVLPGFRGPGSGPVFPSIRGFESFSQLRTVTRHRPGTATRPVCTATRGWWSVGGAHDGVNRPGWWWACRCKTGIPGSGSGPHRAHAGGRHPVVGCRPPGFWIRCAATTAAAARRPPDGPLLPSGQWG